MSTRYIFKSFGVYLVLCFYICTLGKNYVFAYYQGYINNKDVDIIIQDIQFVQKSFSPDIYMFFESKLPEEPEGPKPVQNPVSLSSTRPQKPMNLIKYPVDIIREKNMPNFYGKLS